jgi:hypothetical protein
MFLLLNKKRKKKKKKKKVSLDQGKLIAQSCGALFQETSARSGEGGRDPFSTFFCLVKKKETGVETIFVKAAQAGFEKKKQKEQKKAGIGLNGSSVTEEKSCSC